MLNRRLAHLNNRVCLALYATFLLSGIVGVLVISPPISRARLQVQPATTGDTQKYRRPEYVPGQVLVRYRNDAVAKRQQGDPTALKVEGRSIPIQVERFEGSDLVAGLRVVHVAAEDTMSTIAALKGQADVLYAEPNYIMHADLLPNDPQFGSMYGLTKIGAPTAWDTTTGSNSIVVGIIDEGIDINHPDLQANIFTNPSPGSIPGITGDLHGYDFVHNSGTIPAADHATHTSGTVGAVGNNGVGVVGVNWQVKLMSLKFLEFGSGDDIDAVRAYSYAKQMRDLWVSSGGAQGANIRVLNNSYGGYGFSQALLDSIRALDQSGILFVASEGNDGFNTDSTPHYPSSYDSPNVISVSATDSADGLPLFSNFGAQSATIGAPGVNILSTVTVASGSYDSFSGTSMASPHAAGAAALLLAQNPNLTVLQLKSLLMFNGDPVASLNGKTLTGRRLNVGNSLAAMAANDTTPPGTVTNFNVTSQTGRTFNLGWTASGDDGSVGPASLYQVNFVDSDTGAVVPLRSVVPPASGTPQTLSVKVPVGHSKGAIVLREIDNVGNEGTPASRGVSISFTDGNPYAKALGKNIPLSTGGTPLGLTFDDRYKENYALPFSFPFFGQNYSTVTISTNGNLYFQPPPKRANGDADDVRPFTSVDLNTFKMIAGLWEDLYLATDQRADADIYVVQPDANTIVFRWQGVPCNDNGGGCAFGGDPINFEIELKSDGTIQNRYGSGNTNLLPIVGISGGEPEPYLVTTHSSDLIPRNITNGRTVTFIPRAVMQPLDSVDFFVTQQYRDFLSREPDPGGLTFWTEKITGNAANNPAPCAPGDAPCVNTRRVGVSDAFFVELEYQQTASYVYRLYRAAYGNHQPFPNPSMSNPTEGDKIPLYTKFAADRQLVVGGSNLAQKQLDFANAFVARPEFLTKYPASLATADQFVDAVLATIQGDIGVNLASERTNLINLYNSGGGRGVVMYRLADDNINTNPINNRSFIDAEYNRAFVFGEYSGYLRRNSDIPGFLFWLGQVNSGPLRDLAKQHAMVCSFITSTEYQQRFSLIVTHNNTECQ